MDEELFNLELRKFLKRFGVTAQREIEKAVSAAVKRGTLKGNETLEVHATLSIPDVLPALTIDGTIALGAKTY
jgi:ribosomal protein L1